MKKIITIIALLAIAPAIRSQVLISAIMPNPAGTDSAYEYVQLLATESIDFSVTPYSVIVCNNGTAGSMGWVQGGNITYKFDLSTGTVNPGEVFYVGGSKKRINGPGSTDISGEKWIRDINTANTDGDGVGLHNVTGVMGNAGANADGVAVFAGITPDSNSVPVDAIFYGLSVGGAYTGTAGYQVPDNDHYSHAQGLFGQGSNTWFVFVPGNARDTLISLAGVYDTVTESWVSARSDTMIMLFLTSPVSTLASHILLTGQPSSVNENENSQFRVFFNPSAKTIHVDATAVRFHSEYSLYDISGRMIGKGKVQTSTFDIDVSHLDQCILLLTLEGDTGIQSFKLAIY